MSFSNIEMIHLYIYFKQEKKKIYFFSVAVFFAVFVLRKTQLAGKLLLKEECLFRVMCILGKTVSSDVSGNYLIKGCHQEMLKYLFPALVFNLLIRW
jgi:hypothetical protein